MTHGLIIARPFRSGSAGARVPEIHGSAKIHDVLRRRLWGSRDPERDISLRGGNPDVVKKDVDAVQRMMLGIDGKPLDSLPVEKPLRIVPLIVIPRTRLHEILARYTQVMPFSIPCHYGGTQSGAHSPGVVV